MCKGVYTARVTVFRGSESRAAGESAELKAFEKPESENKNQDGFFKRIINNIKNIFQH